MEVSVAGPLDGERVDRAVSLLLGLSRAVAAELVRNGAVSVDQRLVTNRSARVRVGQELAVRWDAPEPRPAVRADPNVAVNVVYADADVIVVDKAPDVIVHPGNGVVGPTLVSGLLARFPELAEVGEAHRPGIVHRLDRGTSGLLVVARTDDAYHRLVAALSAHDVQRRYLALVIGQLSSASGEIDAPIGRSRHDATRRAVVADGQPAQTAYRVLRALREPEPLTLLACSLHTGRTHQIRVHLKAIGHPVVADVAYGGGRLRLGLDRPFLHAAELAFDHPLTGERLSFRSPVPDDLRQVLADLGVAPSAIDGGLAGLGGPGSL